MLRLLALVLLLLPMEAFAASRVWISEFSVLGTVQSGQAQIGTLPTVANQPTLDISGSVQASAAFNGGTKYIRILCEVQCAVKSGGTATASDTVLPALTPEYFGVIGGATVSVIAAP